MPAQVTFYDAMLIYLNLVDSNPSPQLLVKVMDEDSDAEQTVLSEQLCAT